MEKLEWFKRNGLPYNKMWDSDRYWLPRILEGKRIKATFIWKEDNETVDKYSIDEVAGFIK